MFNIKVVDSDAFLDMPLSTQCLYFHLNMRADDDGFVGNPKRIKSLIGASDDDLKLLIAKRFLLVFEDGVIVIKHWKLHNTIRNDRYIQTVYTDELKMLNMKDNKVYTLESQAQKTDGNQMETKWQPMVSTDIDIGLDLDKEYICANNSANAPIESADATPFDPKMHFEEFWNLYPKKVNKKKAKDKFCKICKNEETFKSIIDGLNIQIKSKNWLKENGQYIPHPTTWLNGERWLDEISGKEVIQTVTYEEMRENDPFFEDTI
ncbi:MAG: hypothetical protein ACLRVU_01115 [Beduini sp.]